MSEIGWTDLAAANAYFTAERLDSSAWDVLATLPGGKDGKTAVLNMAYNRLRFCQDFGIPTSPTAAQLERLKYAQLELAYYLAMHLSDEDRRKGLQAQGVTAAGVVKENYAGGVANRTASEEILDKLPLPPIVRELMGEFCSTDNVYVRDIARDENYRVNEDVTEKEGKLL
jgi:hypothetical protein